MSDQTIHQRQVTINLEEEKYLQDPFKYDFIWIHALTFFFPGIIHSMEPTDFIGHTLNITPESAKQHFHALLMGGNSFLIAATFHKMLTTQKQPVRQQTKSPNGPSAWPAESGWLKYKAMNEGLSSAGRSNQLRNLLNSSVKRNWSET